MPSTIPAYPVPVVRLILLDDRKRVLLLQRSNDTYCGGAWCLPGGKIEYGERVEEVIRRELKEETNLELSSFRFFFFQDSLPTEPGGMHCLNLYFECEFAGALVLNAESSDFVWISKGELAQYRIVFRNDEALQRYWTAE